MKVILKQDIKALGYKDDVVAVRNGYANNYLIPQGMASIANESNIKILAENIKQASYKADKIKNDAVSMSEKMTDLSIKIGVKAGANGKIFGSVTPLIVAQELKNKGFEVDRRKIVFDQDIKNTGSYTATVNLHREISVPVAIEVVAE